MSQEPFLGDWEQLPIAALNAWMDRNRNVICIPCSSKWLIDLQLIGCVKESQYDVCIKSLLPNAVNETNLFEGTISGKQIISITESLVGGTELTVSEIEPTKDNIVRAVLTLTKI